MNRPDRFKTLPLQYPVEFGDTLISELKFRRPRGKELRRLNLGMLDNPDFDFLMNLGADLSAQDPKVFDLMEAEDVISSIELVTDFLHAINPASTRP